MLFPSCFFFFFHHIRQLMVSAFFASLLLALSTDTRPIMHGLWTNLSRHLRVVSDYCNYPHLLIVIKATTYGWLEWPIICERHTSANVRCLGHINLYIDRAYRELQLSISELDLIWYWWSTLTGAYIYSPIRLGIFGRLPRGIERAGIIF